MKLSYTEKYNNCSVTYCPKFTVQEQFDMESLKISMNEAYPHKDGSLWSDNATPVRVDLNGEKMVGLMNDADMICIIKAPYIISIREV
jgi:hypothetical protein